jgi:hypothetical protein
LQPVSTININITDEKPVSPLDGPAHKVYNKEPECLKKHTSFFILHAAREQ